MWDKPDTLRQLANALFGISLLLALYGILHYALRLPEFSLRTVQLSATPYRVDVARIEVVVRNEIRGNFFTVDLEGARHAFEKLPWVRKVSLRRHFPWSLEVDIEEHVALAHWNSAEFVNTHGEVFAAEVTPGVLDASRPSLYGEANQTLPKFIGQPDTAAEVVRMYIVFGEQLAPFKQGITQISLSPRHAWQLRLSNGMVLELGHEQPQQRLARFVAVQKADGKGQGAEGRNMERYVDLRYRNGFAVKRAAEDKKQRAEG